MHLDWGEAGYQAADRSGKVLFLPYAPIETKRTKKMKILHYLLGISGWVQVCVCELVTVCPVHMDSTPTQGVGVADQAIILTTVHCCHMFPGHTKSRWQ